MTQKKLKLKQFALMWCVPYLVITLVLLFMSACSPIYQHAYSITDFNVSLAISKAIGHGEVYFKDIFEQRGLYFYFLQIMSAFMPYYWAKTCVWLLQTFNFFWLFCILRQIGIENTKQSYEFNTIVSTVMVSLMEFNGMFNNSAAPEEWCMVPIAYSVLSLMRFTRNHKLSLKNSFILGLGMGWIIEIKYSNIMAIAGLFFGYGIYMLIQKQFKYFWQTVGVSVGGVLVMHIPAFIYFGVNNAIGQWIKRYFLDNASSIDLVTFFRSWGYYLFYFVPFLLVLSIAVMLTFVQMDKASKWVSASLFIFTMLGVALIGRTGVAYSLPFLVVFMGLSMPNIVNIIPWVKKSPKVLQVMMALCVCIVAGSYINNAISRHAFSTGAIRVFSPAYYHDNNTENIDYKASRLIGEYGGGKVLTYATVTSTIYSYNNEYPKLYYFDQTTMSYKRYPQSFDAQNRYLREKLPVWVEFSTLCTRIPKGMTAKSFDRDTRRNSLLFKTKSLFRLADDTAGSEYEQKYPSQFRDYPAQIVKKPDATYYVSLRLPKVLQKNYAIVFFGLGRCGEISDIYKTDGLIHLVWVRRDMLQKYPALGQQEVDPSHIQRSLTPQNN